ncbi:MAG: hypothetical protein ACOC5R_03475 [Elusimicrobiota bacterium]
MKNLITLSVVVGVMFLFSGCAKKAATPEKTQKQEPAVKEAAEAEVSDIMITTEDGSTTPSVEPGDSIDLVAKGKDSQGNDVSVNPTWAVSDPDMGSVSPEKGPETTFTLAPEAGGIMTFVNAKQDDVSGTITIQISQ